MKKPAKKRYIKYHNDGSVWAKGFIAGGKMEGKWTWFRKDGSKMRVGNFVADTQTGTWTTYAKTGRVVKVTKMK